MMFPMLLDQHISVEVLVWVMCLSFFSSFLTLTVVLWIDWDIIPHDSSPDPPHSLVSRHHCSGSHALWQSASNFEDPGCWRHLLLGFGGKVQMIEKIAMETNHKHAHHVLYQNTQVGSFQEWEF